MKSQVKKFHFGFMPTGINTCSDWLEVAREGEDLGYDTLFLGDHINDWGIFPALMAAASATKTLRVGTMVVGNDFRNPVLVAKDVATVDCLSDGRFELGLGTGYNVQDYTQMGIAYDSPGIRVDRLSEAVQIIKGHFSKETFSFHGKYYMVKDLVGFPQPVQRPHPPIIIGGGGKRVLTLAAREANVVCMVNRKKVDGSIDATSMTLEAFKQKVEWIRQAAGNKLDHLEMMVFVWLPNVTDSQSEAQNSIEAIHEFLLERDPESHITYQQVKDSPYGMAGSEDYLVEKMLSLRERLGISYWVFMSNPAGAAKLVKRLSGQ